MARTNGYTSKGRVITQEKRPLYPKQITTFQTFALITSLGKVAAYFCLLRLNKGPEIISVYQLYDAQKLRTAICQNVLDHKLFSRSLDNYSFNCFRTNLLTTLYVLMGGGGVVPHFHMLFSDACASPSRTTFSPK